MRVKTWNQLNRVYKSLQKEMFQKLLYQNVKKNYSRLAELDQVLVRGPRMEAANIQVRLTQLFPSPAAAVATTVGVGTGGCHLVAGGHIGLLH